MSALELLRDVLSRLAAAREEFEPAVCDQILADLELDLTARLEELERGAA